MEAWLELVGARLNRLWLVCVSVVWIGGWFCD